MCVSLISRVAGFVAVLAFFPMAGAASGAAGYRDHGQVAADNEGFRELSGEARRRDIGRVEAYLSGIGSMAARFTQSSADGSGGEGQFFMKRPGKMRWQYNNPAPLLLVSDGSLMVYYDPGLDQVTYISIDDTLAGFLAQEEITLDSASTRLTGFMQGAGGAIRTTVVQSKKPSEGSLTLEFSDNPLLIRRLITTDASGNETRVTFMDVRFGVPLADTQFVFVDPRSANVRRNRRH